MKGGKVWTPPTPDDWMQMAIKCHRTGDHWAMWIALLMWVSNREDCDHLGVCQGYSPPCGDCPNRRA